MRTWRSGARRLALWALAGVGGCGGTETAGSGTLTAGTLVLDPVCKMEVVVDPDGLRVEHAGRAYHFCSHACRDKFTADPGGFTRE